jgi:hypothetical protein
MNNDVIYRLVWAVRQGREEMSDDVTDESVAAIRETDKDFARVPADTIRNVIRMERKLRNEH